MNKSYKTYWPIIFLLYSYYTTKYTIGQVFLNTYTRYYRNLPGWWFQPLWKMWTSNGSIIPNLWEKTVPNHQTAILYPKYTTIFVASNPLVIHCSPSKLTPLLRRSAAATRPRSAGEAPSAWRQSCSEPGAMAEFFCYTLVICALAIKNMVIYPLKMVIYCYLMGLYSDLVDYEWDIPSGYLLIREIIPIHGLNSG